MKAEDTLIVIFRHHIWANLELLAVCTELTDEQLDTSIVGSYGSVIETLRHIVKAERSYLSRISTGEPYQSSEDEAPLDFDQMRAILTETGQSFIEWAPRVQPEDSVTVDWDGVMRAVPKTILLSQVINHGKEHREQIKTILTQLGIQPPDLQGWDYFNAHDS